MNEVSPERARQILEVLTQGGSMDHINTPLALNLIPLAQELGEDVLVGRLIDHASTMASNPIEQGWTRFEALKQMEAPVDGFIRLAEEGEAMDGGEAFTAAVHHWSALLYLADGRLDEARVTAQRALQLRQITQDHQGMVYGMALLMTIAKRQHDEDTAIAIGTERLELLTTLKDEVGQMEAIAELAHCQATIGEFDVAQDLFNKSLDKATELDSLSGQLVARWGLADLAEIQQDYETAMLLLSDAMHAFIAADIPAPAQLRQRIQDLTELKDQPQGDSG